MIRICQYLQGTKDNGLVFNPSKKLVVDCCYDAYFTGLWVHEYPQDPIFARIITGFVVTFSNCPLLWVSKLHTEIDIYTLHSEYVKLSHSVRALLLLKIIIKEMIENLGIDSEKMNFVSSSTLYEENNGDIVVEISPSMTSTSKQISVMYHWLRHHVGKEFVIHNIESENQKADIFTKVLKGDFFVRIRKLLCGL